MLFKLAVSPKYWAAVEATMPAENGGIQSVKFDAQYHRFTADELEKLREETIAQQLDDRAIARRVICGWRGVGDDDGNEAPFTPENLERMLDVGMAGPITLTFFRSVPQAKRKN